MLKVNHLSVRYEPGDHRRALEDVTFSVADGERVALLGPNGAGKSTLLATLVGILTPEEGGAEADGIPAVRENLREIRRHLGLVFQNPDDQLFMPSVYQDAAFGPRNYGLPEEEISARVDGVLKELGISELRNRMVHKLSGGEKRLAALAGVLVMEPSVLLLDEPTSFLDLEAVSRLTDCLSGLKQSLLITTHDLPFAAGLCTRFLFLDHGKLLGDYTRQKLLEDPKLLGSMGYPEEWIREHPGETARLK